MRRPQSCARCKELKIPSLRGSPFTETFTDVLHLIHERHLAVAVIHLLLQLLLLHLLQLLLLVLLLLDILLEKGTPRLDLDFFFLAWKPRSGKVVFRFFRIFVGVTA